MVDESVQTIGVMAYFNRKYLLLWVIFYTYIRESYSTFERDPVTYLRKDVDDYSRSHIINAFDEYSLHKEYNLGPYVVNIYSTKSLSDNLNPFVEITASATISEKFNQDEKKVLWQSIPRKPFIRLGEGNVTQPPILNGNYQLTELTKYITDSLTIDEVNTKDDNIAILGRLFDSKYKTLEYKYSFDLSLTVNPEGDPIISFNISVINAVKHSHWNKDSDVNKDSDGSLSPRIYFYAASRFDESFHGFGESFTYFSYKGLRVPILVSEQGVGRGEEPITSYLNTFNAEGVGGHWYTTYAPKAIYLTNYNRSIFLDESVVMFIDLTHPFEVEFEVWNKKLSGYIFYGSSWIELIQSISLITGRQPGFLPSWSQQGAVVGLEGGSVNVSQEVQKMMDYGVPVTGVWLQDWVGLRHAWDGDRLIWNWELNKEYYPNWTDLVHQWEKKGAKVLTYISPFFSDPSNFSSTAHNFYLDGIKNEYFVKKEDGSPYKMYSLSIEFCMLDPTNPQAVRWMIDIIKNYTYNKAMSSGFMCDFGEYLPFDAVLYDGHSGAEYHNKYPELWAQIAMQATVESNKLDEALFFMRSAWTRSPASVPIFWLGDQLVSWDGNDGLKSVITGALSSGLTGHAITHSDIGGYTVVIDPAYCSYLRSPELLKRWSELAAFGSGLYRTHIGSSTTPLNAQVYDSDDSMEHFAKFAYIFGNLSSYRSELMTQAHNTGLPLMRPMVLHYFYDQNLWKPDHIMKRDRAYLDREQLQYLFGEDFLIAPTLTEGATRVSFYLPAYSGSWIHLWSGEVFQATDNGLEVQDMAAGLGYPCVLFRESSTYGQSLRAFVMEKGYDAGYSRPYKA